MYDAGVNQLSKIESMAYDDPPTMHVANYMVRDDNDSELQVVERLSGL